MSNRRRKRIGLAKIAEAKQRRLDRGAKKLAAKEARANARATKQKENQ